jgi:hypothetical protein
LELLKGKGIITPVQRNLMITFGKTPDASSFYLTGGTALSEFYLSHRRSYDLDFFTGEENLVIPFSRALEGRLLREQYELNIVRRFESFVEIEVKKEGEKPHTSSGTGCSLSL